MSTSQAEPPATSRDWLALALVALALIATFASGLRALEIVVINPCSDEGLYRAYMQRLDTHGLASFPELFEDRPGLASTDSHEAPYRVGYIALTWLAAKLFGPTFEALTYVSFACQVLLVLAVWWLGRPLFGALFAACLALALACSPLLMRLSVQPLTDSATTLSAGVAVLLFLELLARPRRGVWWAFVAAFAFALSVKELSGLLVVPFAAMYALERFARRTQLAVVDAVVALVLPGVACVALWMLAAWDTTAAVRYLWTGLVSTGQNEYMLTECTGPWHRNVIDLALLSPLPAVLAFVGVGALLIKRSEWRRLSALPDERADSSSPALSPANPAATSLRASLVAVALFAGVLLLVAGPLPKNVRYFAILELPLRALEVAAIAWAAGRFAPRRAAWWTAAAVAALAALDLYAGNLTFLHVDDPLHSTLMRLRGLAP